MLPRAALGDSGLPPSTPACVLRKEGPGLTASEPGAVSDNTTSRRRYHTNYSDGWRYSPAITVLPVTWQATIKPYKHQITHLGRVDVVIFAENFFFCCENSGVKRGKNPTGGPRPTLPTPS